MKARNLPRAFVLAAALALTPAACGGLVSQAISVQRNVEARNYDVESVEIKKSGGQKIVIVKVLFKANDQQRAEIEEAARAVVPDATEVQVKRVKKAS